MLTQHLLDQGARAHRAGDLLIEVHQQLVLAPGGVEPAAGASTRSARSTQSRFNWKSGEPMRVMSSRFWT